MRLKSMIAPLSLAIKLSKSRNLSYNTNLGQGMILHVFKRACAPSLLAAALIAAAWVMSYRTGVTFHSAATIGQPRWDASSARGMLLISVTQDSPIDRARHLVTSKNVIDPGWQRHFDAVNWKGSYAGFSATEQMTWMETDAAVMLARPTSKLVIPFWMLFAVAVAPSAYRFGIAFRGKWRAAQGMCPDCGYNLVGVETPQGCPACAAIAIAVEVAPEAAQLATAI